MTTETRTGSPTGSSRAAGARVPDAAAGVLAQSLVATTVTGAAVAAAAGLLDGRAAALGVLAGLAVAVAVFALGSFTVNAVARVLPAAAVLVALLTYALQLLVLVAALSAVERSGALADTLDRTWLGGALIGATAVWLVAQVVLHLRRRQPVYDLAPGAPSATASEAGPRPPEGSAR